MRCAVPHETSPPTMETEVRVTAPSRPLQRPSQEAASCGPAEERQRVLCILGYQHNLQREQNHRDRPAQVGVDPIARAESSVHPHDEVCRVPPRSDHLPPGVGTCATRDAAAQ
eukprot:3684007-Prymnesium_polylepis.2